MTQFQRNTQHQSFCWLGCLFLLISCYCSILHARTLLDDHRLHDLLEEKHLHGSTATENSLQQKAVATTATLDFINVDSSAYLQYIATNDNGTNVITGGLGSIYISTDYGFTLSLAPFTISSINLNSVDISGNGVWYFATTSNPSLFYRSTNPMSTTGWIDSTTAVTSVLEGISAMDVDESGQHVVIVYGTINTQNAYAAFSSDYGATFTVLNGVTQPCTSVSIDSTGGYIVAGSTTGHVFVSSNSGSSFTSTQLFTNEKALQIVSSKLLQNQYIFAVEPTNLIHMMMSNNSGVNWYSEALPSSSSPGVIACSGSGSNLVGGFFVTLYSSSTYGAKWTTSASFGVEPWGIAVSGNGQNIYVATISGAYLYHEDSSLSVPPSLFPTNAPTPTFAPSQTPQPTHTPAPTVLWTSVSLPDQGGYNHLAINNGGTFMVALPGSTGYPVFYSINESTGSSQISQNKNVYSTWTSLSMSYDGSVVVYIGNSVLYYSLDMSTTLQGPIYANSQSSGGFNQVAVSGNSLVVITAAAGYYDIYPISIYSRPSTDVPFDPVMVPVQFATYGGTFSSLVAVAADYSGQTLSVLLTTGLLYISNDKGATWNFNKPLSVPAVSYSFFMSQYDNGSNMVTMSSYLNEVYLSTNEGNKWQQSSTNGFVSSTTSTAQGFTSISGNYYGEYLILASNEAIYLSRNYGVNWTYAIPMSSGTAGGRVASDPSGMYVGAVSTTSIELSLYTVTNVPSFTPTFKPTVKPTISLPPSMLPSIAPTIAPTVTPSLAPSIAITQYDFLQSEANYYFNTIVMDASGNIGAAIYSNVDVFVSTDMGYNWVMCSSQPIITGCFLEGLAISGNGQYIFAYTSAYPIPTMFRASNMSSSPYNQWTPIGSGIQLNSIVDMAVDYTGQSVVIIGSTSPYIQLSNNYGATFVDLPSNVAINTYGYYFAHVTMDNSGSYIAIATVNGLIFESNNTGQSFAIYSAYPAPNPYSSPKVASFATSTGNCNQYQYLFQQTQTNVTYISSDRGIQWNKILVQANAPHLTDIYVSIQCATSSTGQYVVFTLNNYIYFSANYGLNFEIIYTYPNAQISFTSVALSASGEIIFVSSNYGILTYRAGTANTIPPTAQPSFAPTAASTIIELPALQGGYGAVAISGNGQYVTVLPALNVYGNIVFYTASTQHLTQSTSQYYGYQVCMSENGMNQILILSYAAYYTNSYDFNINAATLMDVPENVFVEMTLCGINSGGNVAVIGTTNPSTTYPPLLIYVQTPGSEFVPVFTPVTSFPFGLAGATGSMVGLEVDTTGQVIAAMTSSGTLYLSLNQGSTWTTTSSSKSHLPTNIMSFTMSQYSNNAGKLDMLTLITNPTTYLGSAAYSNTSGQSWNTTSNGFAYYTYPWSNIDVSYSGAYAVAASGSGVYLSTNYGHSWTLIYPAVASGLGSYRVAIDPAGVFTALTQGNSNQLRIFQTMNVPTLAPTISSSPTTATPTFTKTLTPTRPPVFPPTASPTMKANFYPFVMIQPIFTWLCCSVLATDSQGMNGLGYSPGFSLFMFSDYGFTWTSISGFYPSASLSAIAVSGNSKVFLAAAGRYLYSSVTPSVGTSWDSIFVVPTTTAVIADIGVSNDGSNIVIVMAQSPYAYLSTNSGVTFTTLTSLSSASGVGGLTSVTMDSTGNYIAATSPAGYVFVSTDGGATFTSTQVITNPAASTTYLIAGSAGNANQYLYLSPDSTVTLATSIVTNAQQGASTAWSSVEVDPGGIYPTSIAVSSNGKTVVLATSYAVFINENFGNSNDWIEIYQGGGISSVVVSSTASNIYIGTSSQVYVYHNDSSITPPPTTAPSQQPYYIPPQQSSNPTLPPSLVIDLPPSSSYGYTLVAVSNSGNYYTAAQGNAAQYSPGKMVFYETNGNMRYVSSFTALWTDLSMSSDGSVQVMIGNNIVYYVTGYEFTGGIQQATFNTGLSTQYVKYCAINGNGNVLVVAQSSSYPAVSFPLAIYVNPTGTWQSFNPALVPMTTVPAINGIIVDVALDSTGQIISILTSAGYLYVSSNQGSTWTIPTSAFTPNVPSNVNSLTMSQNNNGQYISIAASSTLGTYYSTNQGSSFTYTTNGLSSYSWGGWYNLASSYSGQYQVGAMDEGIFLSTDYGTSWHYIMGFTGSYAYVAIDPVGGIVSMVNSASSQISLYRVPNVPTPAPTTIRPTVSSAPTLTHYPTYAPTAKPTGTPTMTTGWVYQGFYGETDCSGPELNLFGYRIGVCFQNSDGGGFMYSCDGNVVTTYFYGQSDCSGTSTNNVEHDVNINYPDAPYGCGRISCETFSTSLPLSPSKSYSVGDYYEDSCTNAYVSFAEVNDQCVTVSSELSYYVHYPWQATYKLPNCQGPASNISYPLGCYFNPSDVDDDYIVINATSFVGATSFSPKMTKPMFPLKSNDNADGKPFALLRGGEGPSNTAKHLSSLIHQHYRWKGEFIKHATAVDSTKEDKSTDRELGIWYHYDDTMNQIETFQYTFVPVPTPAPVLAPGSTTSSSSELSSGAIAGIVLGSIAFIIMAGVGVGVFIFGWTAFGLTERFGSVNGKKNGNVDVQPNLEMSFDYGSPKGSSVVATVDNPILANSARRSNA